MRTAEHPRATASGASKHLPALDGLRGIALLGVLAFHANGALTGGYLGVDLFFVLSGFLITRLLLAEHRATGTIALSSFWVRRARRLLPALLVLMPAIALYARLLARPEELGGIRADALATLGYVANWRAIWSHKSYFDLFLSPSPLEHTWSLAIEEQFYLVWPLITLLALRLRGSRGLLAVTLALGAASMMTMLVLFSPERTTRVYYGTDTRAAGLLAGAAFSVLSVDLPALSLRTVRWLDVGGLFALGGMGFAWASIDGRDFILYRGGFWMTEALSLVLLACALMGSRSLVARALSFRPLRALGAVSYGAYLWHWPANLVVTPERFHVHGLALWVLRFSMTAGIATLSYYFLEQPIRRNGLPFGRARWVVPLTFGVAAFSVVIGTHAKPTPPARLPTIEREAAAAPVALRFRVRLIGDSTANALAGTLRSVATPDVAVEPLGKDALNLIDADEFHFPPDDPKLDATVVSVGGAFLYGIHASGKWTGACHPRWHALFENGLNEHLREVLHATGSVWVSTVPYPLGPYDDAVHRKQVDCINTSIRKIAAKYPKLSILDIAELVCPKHDCEQAGGLTLRPDGVHFHVPAAGRLGHEVLALVDPAGHHAVPAVD